jgi:hypothetical protein
MEIRASLEHAKTWRNLGNGGYLRFNQLISADLARAKQEAVPA